MMKRVLFISCLLGGLLFLFPDWIRAQDGSEKRVGIELTGNGNSSAAVVFNYRVSETRNQLCIPPEVLCLPEGTQIRAITIPYIVHSESTLTQSLGNMRIALGESSSVPTYEQPYSYIKDGMTECYNGSDLLDVTTTGKKIDVTYYLSSTYVYKGGICW